MAKMKIFDIYETEDVKIEDPGLKRCIDLQEKLTLKEAGRAKNRFGKAKVNIVERIANRLGVSGHRGKKHRIITGHATGKYYKNMKAVIECLKIIEKKTSMNPIQVLVNAIEKAAPKDEVTIIEYGGARYPQAVDISPLRRVNIAIRNIVHGAYDRAFNKKTKIQDALAEEIIQASNKSSESYAIKKKNESEKQADSAR
jgi:small subunit ribosomal protein S7